MNNNVIDTNNVNVEITDPNQKALDDYKKIIQDQQEKKLQQLRDKNLAIEQQRAMYDIKDDIIAKTREEEDRLRDANPNSLGIVKNLSKGLRTVGDLGTSAARYTGINKAATAASNLTGKAANVALRGTKLLATPITAPTKYLYGKTKKLLSSDNYSTNSGTQKNNVRSTGPGKKITITFIQDDRNQCFIKDYNLCSVDNVSSELSNVYDDKLVIDGNNKPVKSNIQNIGKNQQVTYKCDSGASPVTATSIETDTNAIDVNNAENNKTEVIEGDVSVEDKDKNNDNTEDNNGDVSAKPEDKNNKPSFFNRILGRKGGYNASKSITRRKSVKPITKRLLRYSRRSRNSRKF